MTKRKIITGALWQEILANDGPVLPPVRNGVAAAVHNRKKKADAEAEKRSGSRRVKIRRIRL